MEYFTFSWGNNYIAIRGLLRALGHSLATPRRVSLNTIKTGSELAHPFLCYSGKIVIGQIAEQLAAGQRNFIFISSLGAEACRCADTAGIMQSLFRERYPDFHAVRLGGNWSGELFANLQEHFPGVSPRQCQRAYQVFMMKLELLYLIGRTCLKLRSLAVNPEQVRSLEKEYTDLVDQRSHPISLIWTGIQFNLKSSIIKRKKVQPGIRIGIIGGEHILSELDFIMAKIKDIAERDVYLDWRSGFRMIARNSFYENPLKGKEGFPFMQRLCQKYLHPASQTTEVISCAHALEFAEEGFDGVIHIYAMGCMPQTSLKPALHKISTDRNLPILSLNLGDKFNEAGVETRLEAFIDMLKHKKTQLDPVIPITAPSPWNLGG